MERRARVIAERLSVLADLWIAGAPPTAAQLQAVADDIAHLHQHLVPSPTT